MEEIIGAIMFEIDNSGCREKLSAGLVITGGGSLLKNLPQFMGFKTGFDVRVGYPNQYLVPGVSKKINQPMFATSIGLAIEGEPTGMYSARNMFPVKKKNAGPGIKDKVIEGWSKFFSDEGENSF